tara:strand:- start:367 stop:669 length:303 start_codon:yes stop_codon:yes gene_type:complete
MKKIWKYIAGFFTIVVGGLLAFLSGRSAGRKDEKLKGLKGESKKVSKRIKDREKETSAFKQSLANKKKALKEIEKEKYKKKNVGAKEASDFLKKYARGKK